MVWLIDILWVLAGVVALYFGAEWLVTGSSRLAVRVGISPLVVGLTVVAFGTSSPEFFVCLSAALKGHGDFAVGNAVGSNIANAGLILASAAIITPLVVHVAVLKRDVPLLVLVSLGFVALIWDNEINRIEGAFLFASLVWYTVHCVRASRRERASREVLAEYADLTSPEDAKKSSLTVLLLLILAGLVTLYFGALWLQKGGVGLATRMGVPEAIISLTLIAVGTSLPELAASLMAAFRREADIAVGNVIGSNLFNLLGALGLSAMVKPLTVKEISRVDLWMMVGITTLLVVLMGRRRQLDRIEGVLLLLVYLGYCIYLGVARIPHAG